MPEQNNNIPENYWREALKRFRLRQAEMLKNPVPDLSGLDNISEDRARTALEVLERIQVLIDNHFIIDNLQGEGDGEGE